MVGTRELVRQRRERQLAPPNRESIVSLRTGILVLSSRLYHLFFDNKAAFVINSA